MHLVGDLHQPLHVGCCYISAPAGQLARLVKSPDEAERGHLPSDEGGNALILDLGGTKDSLHHFWDDGILQTEMVDGPGKVAEERFINMALTKVGVPQVRKVDINVYALALEWATDSVTAARSAYESISIKKPVGNGKYDLDWEGQDLYVERNGPILKQQLALGGTNLADLLDAIWP